MNELTDFLLARIAEDEGAARAVEPPGRPLEGGRYHSWHSSETGAIGNAAGQVVVYGSGLGDSEREHIARHDPARVLAECAAKRDLIRVCTAELSGRDIEGAMSDGDDGPWLADHVLHTLAAVYADHPDYRAEWAL